MGSILLARKAGLRPETTPVTKLKIIAKTITLKENNIGISNNLSKVPPSMRLKRMPAIPPRHVMMMDSKRNESKIPLLDAPYARLIPISFLLSCMVR